MTSTRELFAQGMTAAEYIGQMTVNGERLEANERTVVLPGDDVHFFAQLPESLPVIILTEDWCEPAINSIPVLMRLAAESGKLNLRFFLRDHNPELMNQYLKDGIHPSIPTFVFFDQAFHELGRWIEFPALIGDMRQTMLDELFTTDPVFAGVARGTPISQLPEAARLRAIQALIAFSAETRELANREVVRELRGVVERGLAANT
jgi:hypothetical protein